MKKLLICVLIVLLCGLTCTPVYAQRAISRSAAILKGDGEIGEYRALIIAINDYKDPAIPDLETPLNDAKAMKDVLTKRYGFKTEMLIGKKASRKGIYNKLRKLTSTAKKDDSLLIYYAGHGERDRVFNDGWWVPYDAKGGEADTYLDNTVVQKAMRSTKARHVLLISDSCYSGALFGSSRSIPPVLNESYYKNMYSEKSRWGITSGNKEPVSDSGTDGHSVFAYQLIKTLKKNQRPFISSQEIYTHIAPIIGNNSEQTPMCRPVKNTGDQGGQFIFLLASSGGYVSRPSKSKKENGSYLSVTSNISGSEVYIDGKHLGTTDLKRVSISPGKHRIEVSKEGYETYSKTINVRKGRSVSFQAFLDEVQEAKAALYIDTVPEDAKIRILNIAPTFHQGIELDKGRYQIEVSASGYKSEYRWVELRSGEDKTLDIRLNEGEPKTVKRVSGSGKTITNTAGMKFVYIKPGTFTMGSNKSYLNMGVHREKPAHEVTLTRGFYIQTTEVTQGQWVKVMGTRPWEKKGYVRKETNSPAVYISWEDCQAFISRLNDKEGGDRYRLPTEAEWEYAARGGSRTDFCYGDDRNQLGNYGWYRDNADNAGEKYAHAVGTKKPNAYGLYDMHGNVNEWCADWFKGYKKEAVTDPTGPESGSGSILQRFQGSTRVCRGGSWMSKSIDCRSTVRNSYKPRSKNNYLGFRICRNP